MLKVLAILSGLVLISVGIMGFLPDYVHEGKLFSLFLVNPMHNVVHIALGVLALLCGLSSNLASKIFFILAGLGLAALAVFGFLKGDGLLFNLIAYNKADTFLHGAVAVIFLYFGLFIKSK
jgi:hypothetical protein